MREIRTSGSEGGGIETNRFSLPLFSIHVRSRGEEALLIGDVAHHPCQLARLDWSSTVDSDPQQAIRTRHDLFSRFTGTPARILGGHFTGGAIVRDGDAFRLAM
jgi:glyoxylase-like metal-dependent hydrolase (beta-lactamase superfamily II)